MTCRRVLAVGLCGWLAALLVSVAAAQSYPQLHVIALAQRSDRSTVEPNGVFHVTIHVRITQRRDRLDELILGSFTNCEIISNETVRAVVPGGTDFVERLTLQALAPGDATISPAYIDAIDPTLGKPMRFSSNAIVVRVTGGDPVNGLLENAADKARRLVLALLIVVCVLAAGFVVFVLFVRRKRRPAPREPSPSPITPSPAPTTPVTAGERLMRAARAYRGDRSQAAIAPVRAMLFECAGSPPGATLIDALRALGERDPELRRALIAAEGAAFGPAAERVAAGDAMLAAIQAYSERTPTNESVWIR